MDVGIFFAALPVLGILAGLARAKYPRVPFVAAGLVAAAYALLLAGLGVWSGICWDCGGLGQSRGDVLLVSAIFFGLLTITTLVGIWLGARLVTMLQRLRRTWRELRGSDGEGETTTPGNGEA